VVALSLRSYLARGGARVALGAAVLLLASAAPSSAVLQSSDAKPAGSAGAGAGTGVAATLVQCVTVGLQSERSATFAAEMSALPGTARMSIRIEIEERLPGELAYHLVSSPGLGVWRASDVKVKIYKYLKQVTNLSSPALYRALVRFRWVNARGAVIKRAERFTPRCAQPASAATPDGQPAATSGAAPPAPF
jgi:hypothetical protein